MTSCGRIEKVGSLYTFSDIQISGNKITNVLSKNGNFIIRNASVRLIGIDEDSVITVNINGVPSSYILSDLNAMFQGDTRVAYIPYISHYYVGSSVDDNEFVISLFTDDFISSININVKPNSYSSSPKYAVEYVMFVLPEKLGEVIPIAADLKKKKQELAEYGSKKVI